MENRKIIELLQGFRFEISDFQANQLVKLMDLTLEKNEHLNLTAIRDRNEFILKMIIDSALSFHLYFKDINALKNKSILDIGTGAGFPGLVLSILYPECQFTLLDSTTKKIVHVNETIEKLGLKNAIGISGRAEEIIKNYREKFDIVTARAVSDIFILSELAAPFCKVGGHFIALKTKDETLKKEKLDSNAKKLGLKIQEEIDYELPEKMGARTNIYYTKIKETNRKYPREYKDIKLKPLY